MKCHVINLATRPDRWAHMEREFGRLGLTIERSEAVHWKDLEASGYTHPIFPLGHVACSFSHLDLMRRIGEGSEPWAAIFEDDIYLTDDAARFLSSTDWIPAGAGVVKLETFATIGYYRRRAATTASGHTTHELLHKHTGAAAYIVSREFAAAFAASVDPRTAMRKIDELLFDPRFYPAPQWGVFQLRPAIAVQEMVIQPKGVRHLASDIGTFTKEFGWRPDPATQAKYTGVVGRLRMITKAPRDWLKARMRFVRLALKNHTLSMRMEMVDFAPRADMP